jgi:uncharacterized protein (TIGR02147 family)
MESIYTYLDYRRFLADYYRDRKENTTYFSYRWFSRRAGIGSPTFLKQVIDGSRSLTRTTMEKFCRALELDGAEGRYFRHLVGFNQADTAAEKQEHFDVLRTMHDRITEKQLSEDQYAFYRRWYVPVVRELVCMVAQQDDYERLAVLLQPRITPRQVRDAIDLMKRLRLLVPDPASGRLKQNDPAVTTGDEVFSRAVRNFNAEMLLMASRALERLPREERHVSGITLGISADGYHKLCTEINAFKDRVVQIVNHDHGSDRVCQLNVQLFPVTSPTQTMVDSGDAS